MLACDGVWDNFTSQDAVKLVHRKVYKDVFKADKLCIDDLSVGVEQVVDACCSKDIQASEGIGSDNITALLVEFRK